MRTSVHFPGLSAPQPQATGRRVRKRDWRVSCFLSNVVDSRMPVIVLALGCVLGTTACDGDSPAGPTVPLAEQFTLAPGESAFVEEASVVVRFLRVSSDSRCPADAVCIQAGDAIVLVRVGGGGAEYELHTNDGSRAAVTHGAFRIELVRLEPYPFSGSAIDPASYRATLVVSR